MKTAPYRLKSPCDNCPFRTDITPFIKGERAEEIFESLVRGATFPCHKTLDYDSSDDGSPVEKETTAHCAGALIMLEHMNMPNQMMRIAERIGVYDPARLDMNAPVYDDADEFINSCYEYE